MFRLIAEERNEIRSQPMPLAFVIQRDPVLDRRSDKDRQICSIAIDRETDPKAQKHIPRSPYTVIGTSDGGGRSHTGERHETSTNPLGRLSARAAGDAVRRGGLPADRQDRTDARHYRSRLYRGGQGSTRVRGETLTHPALRAGSDCAGSAVSPPSSAFPTPECGGIRARCW